MFGIPWVEWVGYAASLAIAISLIMNSFVKLRIINSVGCLLFIVYGFLVKAYPVAVANLIIIFINLYHLYNLNNHQDKEK